MESHLRRSRLASAVAWLLFAWLLAGPAVAKDAGPPVGFETVSAPNGDEPPLRVGVWYPSAGVPSDRALEDFTQRVLPHGHVDGRRLPLVMISHGGGGSLAGHYDTALALARAGSWSRPSTTRATWSATTARCCSSGGVPGS